MTIDAIEKLSRHNNLNKNVNDAAHLGIAYI